MNLHHLQVFLAIAAEGSITAAAANLHISQPALSRELKTFEERLRVTLFERVPKGMRLTHAGEVLRDYATRLFELEAAAEAAMQDIAGARRGRLAIAASNTIGTYVLPAVLADFRRARPGVQVSLFVGNTEQVAQGVTDLHYTLGFVEGPLHLDGLHTERFQDDEIVPVAAPDHPLLRKRRLAVRDFSGQPLLMREPGSGSRELVTAALRAQHVDAGNIMEFGNTEALKRAAVHAGGVAWLPRISMTDELREGILRVLPIGSLTIARPFNVVWRRTTERGPLARAFLKLVHSQRAEAGGFAPPAKADSKLPLPQGEGWGEGNSINSPSS